MKVSSFDVLKAMSERDMDIQIAPLNNITKMHRVKSGTQITIGVPADAINRITNGEVLGGFLIANRKEFERVRKELESLPFHGEAR